jgi:hypothetical protein
LSYKNNHALNPFSPVKRGQGAMASQRSLKKNRKKQTQTHVENTKRDPKLLSFAHSSLLVKNRNHL